MKGRNLKKLSLAAIFALSLCANEDEVEFGTVDVYANDSKEQAVYKTSGAVSAREGISEATQSIDSIIRSMPGTYTNTDQSQGSVNVNIRGATGLGRVDMMVDGVTQTYFGTSADQGKFHLGEGTVGTSSYGALVDPAFLVSVEVERGTFDSGHSSIMGSANFRTIGVDDVVRGDRNFGFYTRMSYGSNGVGPSIMGTLAAKEAFDSGFYVGGLFGYSWKKIKQNYKIGGGSKITDLSYYDDYSDDYTSVSPIDANMLTQRPKNYLGKIEFGNEDNDVILTYRKYDNYLAGRDIDNDTYQLTHEWHPDSPYWNVNLLASYNVAKQLYTDEASLYGRSVDSLIDDSTSGLKTENKTKTFDLSNSAVFDFDETTKLVTKIGASYVDNEYSSTKALGEEFDGVPFNPSGRLKTAQLYWDNEFNVDIFTFNANLNLAHWKLSGYKGECEYSAACFPKEATNVSMSETNFNYSLMASAEIHTLFAPFVTYTRSVRPPTVQEMFFSMEGGEGVNPYLKPEKSETYQLGFNSYAHDLFADHDFLGFKLTYFNTKVKNYIYNKTYTFYSDPDQMYPHTVTLHQNYQDKAKFRGVEAELNYDMGGFFAKLSYSHEKQDTPISETMGGYAGSFGYSQVTILPEDYGNLEIGTRWFDEKLTIGAIAKYTGQGYRVYPANSKRDDSDPDDWWGELQKQKLPKIPTIIDVYAEYKPVENLTLKFEVQNIADKNYMDALNAYNDNDSDLQYDSDGNDIYLFSNSARGRTFLMSFSYKY